jgi:hypothetical protein
MSVTITAGEDTWHAGGFADITELFMRIDTALGHLEHGLPLLTQAPTRRPSASTTGAAPGRG